MCLIKNTIPAMGSNFCLYDVRIEAPVFLILFLYFNITFVANRCQWLLHQKKWDI